MKYRDILYRNYSQHFQKPSVSGDDDAVQFGIFDAIYPTEEGRGGVVLDLACGRGAWLRWMKRRGAVRLVGVDLSEFDLGAVQLPGVELVNEDLFAYLRKQEGKFNIIHAKDVIEHLTKDEVVEFLILCRDRLVEGGALWVSTFNALAPMASQTWRGDFTHEMAFTPSSMKQVMRACGFTDVSVMGCHPVPSTVKGRIRRCLMKGIAAACCFVGQLRYGFSADLNCLPSLLAIGKIRIEG